MDLDYLKQYEPIDGKWYFTKELGSGAYGTVFEVQRKDFSDMKAAMKVVSIPNSQIEVKNFLDENFDMDEKSVTSYFYGFVEEFIKEFQVMARLKGHSNIVSYEDHDVKQKKDEFGWDIFIRMELLTPMSEYFKATPPKQSDIIKIGIDLCKALEVCQKYNIIHRDIKPSNIFISESGEFKLGDFGVARTLEKTSSGLSKKGTYTYMAPEVFKGEKYGSNVDIYSLGIVMYKLLNNNLEPFRMDRTYAEAEKALERRMLGSEMPKPANAEGRLAEIVLKACAFDPKQRYESPVQMRQELESIQYSANEGKAIFPDGDNVAYEPTGETNDITSEKTEVISKSSSEATPDDGTISVYDVAEQAEEKTEALKKPDDVDLIQCPVCKTMCKKNQKFCKGCGKNLVQETTPPVKKQETKNCPFCGRVLPKDHNFCMYCGKYLHIQQNNDQQKTIHNTDVPGYNNQIPQGQGYNNQYYNGQGYNTQNYGMKPTSDPFKEIWDAYTNMWKNYASFNGRLGRKEFWYAYLVQFVFSFMLLIIGIAIGTTALSTLFGLATMVPTLAMGARRLHDTNRSAHWLWLTLTGYGAIALIVFWCQDSVNNGNKYNNQIMC